jgi:hypothetical protein
MRVRRVRGCGERPRVRHQGAKGARCFELSQIHLQFEIRRLLRKAASCDEGRGGRSAAEAVQGVAPCA